MRGGADVVRGGTDVVRGRAHVVRGGAHVVRGRAHVVRSRAHVVRGGADVVRGKAHVVRGGARVVRGRARGEEQGSCGEGQGSCGEGWGSCGEGWECTILYVDVSCPCSVVIAKLDVLDTFKEIRIGVSYTLDGKPVEGMPGEAVVHGLSLSMSFTASFLNPRTPPLLHVHSLAVSAAAGGGGVPHPTGVVYLHCRSDKLCRSTSEGPGLCYEAAGVGGSAQ